MSAFVQGIANSQAFRMAAPDAPAAKNADVGQGRPLSQPNAKRTEETR